VTREEWFDQVRAAYADGGFTVKGLHGFPLIEIPESIDDTVRLLELRPPFSASCRIYEEGMIVLPV
jgi:hypothetical protein